MECEKCRNEISKAEKARLKAFKKYERARVEKSAERRKSCRPLMIRYLKASDKAEKEYNKEERKLWREYVKKCKVLGLQPIHLGYQIYK